MNPPLDKSARMTQSGPGPPAQRASQSATNSSRLRSRAFKSAIFFRCQRAGLPDYSGDSALIAAGCAGLVHCHCNPKYIPDFLICDTNSAGVRWLLVELETPHSAITLNSRNDLDEVARKGVSQIKEWREWLQNNLGMARRSPREDGLGLVDVRPKSGGLVLVGRRARLKHNSGFVRNAIREDSAIRIHTYDWLVEQLLGNLQFNGPPALSPYVIPPPREKNWLFGDAV